MVDVFGGSRRSYGRGPRGPKGLPGIPGSINDFCKWLPNSILNQLQTHEEFCYILSSFEDVTKNEKDLVTEWLSRNKRHFNYIAEIPGEFLNIQTSKCKLDFKHNRYKNDEQDIFACLYGSGYFCITFKINQGEELQTIVTNHQIKPDIFHQFHEISACTNEIRIDGYKDNKPSYIIIQHDCRIWTTIFIEYKITSSELLGSYIINNDPSTQGNFSFQKPILCKAGIYLGSRHNNTKFLNGAIHAIESYFVPQNENLSPDLQELIIINQMIT